MTVLFLCASNVSENIYRPFYGALPFFPESLIMPLGFKGEQVMEIMKTVEFGFSKTEEYLSRAAAVPVAGTLPAAVKVALGAIQILAAAACIAVASIPAAITLDVEWLRRPGEHLLAGIQNVVIGVFEGIPFVGTAIYVGRAIDKKKIAKAQVAVSNGNDFNVPYNSLREVRFLGTNDDLVQKARGDFEAFCSGKMFSDAKRFQIAVNIAKKCSSQAGVPSP